MQRQVHCLGPKNLAKFVVIQILLSLRLTLTSQIVRILWPLVIWKENFGKFVQQILSNEYSGYNLWHSKRERERESQLIGGKFVKFNLVNLVVDAPRLEPTF